MHPNGILIDPDSLRSVAAFDGLDSAEIAAIASGGWVVESRRGGRVITRGDRLDGLYFVLEGRLKLYMLSCSGDERVLRVLQEGDSFGEAIMFNEFPSPVFVDALSPARLGFLPRELVSDALARLPGFTEAMLKNMSSLMRNLITDLETACLQNAVQRTANYLLRESQNSPPPYAALTLPAPKAVIASTLNLSAETFSRELHRLQDLGLIEIERRVIFLRDRAALRGVADGGPLVAAD